MLEYPTFKSKQRVVIHPFAPEQPLQVLTKANDLEFGIVSVEACVKLPLTLLLHCHFGNSATVFGYQIDAFLMQMLTGNSLERIFFKHPPLL